MTGLIVAASCAGCKFYSVPGVAPGTANCRRFPPTLTLFRDIVNRPPPLPPQPIINPQSVFAQVSADMWCGEYRPKVALANENMPQ